MDWLQFIVAAGYFLLLLALMTLLHTATLICKNLYSRHMRTRQPNQAEPVAVSLKRVA